MPGKQLTAGMRRMAAGGHGQTYGWTEAIKERIASQVGFIRHWRVLDGDYTAAPRIAATWFIDPPYVGRPGAHYIYGSREIDYAELGAWCRRRAGQIIVCEAEGADWLPFRDFGESLSIGARRSREVLWTK